MDKTSKKALKCEPSALGGNIMQRHTVYILLCVTANDINVHTHLCHTGLPSPVVFFIGSISHSF